MNKQYAQVLEYLKVCPHVTCTKWDEEKGKLIIWVSETCKCFNVTSIKSSLDVEIREMARNYAL